MNNSKLNWLLRRALPVLLCMLFVAACNVENRFSAAVFLKPDASTIPANTLRLYIHFSEPMARGQVSNYIYLENEMSEKVINPFLNLKTELWNSEQTRLTLLFDPGRIKQGVGPNEVYGSPLIEGREYSLCVSKDMKTATGEELGTEYRETFNIGPALRSAITPKNWTLQSPQSQTRSDLTIRFDRLMDTAVAVSLLKVKNQAGDFLEGTAISDGVTWNFTPSNPWEKGSYELIVPPSLEDIAGNTPYSSFDAKAGTIAIRKQLITLKFKVP